MAFLEVHENWNEKARKYVNGFMRGSDKDKEATRRLLLDRADKRHDPMSVAIVKILREKKYV